MTTTEYNIGPVQRLVDLNGEDINFEVKFNVVAKDNADFYAGVSTQKDIETGNLELKRYTGTASGLAKNVNSTFENYFLVLKAPRDISVKVTLNRSQIQIQKDQTTQQESSDNMIMYIVSALVIVGVVYYLSTRKKD